MALFPQHRTKCPQERKKMASKIDDRNTWISLTDSRGMSEATVHQLPSGEWHARANDGGGMALNYATASTPLEALAGAKFFGRSRNVHEGIATLAQYISRHDRTPGVWSIACDAFEPDDVEYIPHVA
jgi:hypothetical protein